GWRSVRSRGHPPGAVPPTVQTLRRVSVPFLTMAVFDELHCCNYTAVSRAVYFVLGRTTTRICLSPHWLSPWGFSGDGAAAWGGSGCGFHRPPLLPLWCPVRLQAGGHVEPPHRLRTETFRQVEGYCSCGFQES